MLKNFQIGTKLYVGFGVVIMLAMLLAGLNYRQYGAIAGDIQVAQAEHYPILKGATQLVKSTKDVQQYLTDMAATRGLNGLDDGIEQAKQAATKFYKTLDELRALDAEHDRDLQAMKPVFDEYLQTGLDLVDTYVMSGPESGNLKMPEFDEDARRIVAMVDAYFAAAETDFDQGLEIIESRTASASATGVWVAVCALVIGLIIAYYVARLISRPVIDMAAAAERISFGDIDVDVSFHSKDEIGTLAHSFRRLISYFQEIATAADSISENDLTVAVEPKSEKDVLGLSFARMIGNLTTMVRQLGDNAGQLVSAANQIAASSEQMSRGANDQAQQVGQVGTAIEEMTATILEASRNTGEASESSKSASETARSGGQIVSDTIHGMQKIGDVVRQSAASITKLAGSADQIGEIISVIDDIADQTNLLALNAAIEAARAGEQGRGFAVVADEVRKLAERTGKATGEITDMIKGIQSETTEAVASMEAGIQEVDKGRAMADKAGNSLQEIVSMSERVMDMIQQISTSSEEQSVAAEQISKNIEYISSVTKETAAGAEQSAAAAEELHRSAESLQGIVGRFRVVK